MDPAGDGDERSRARRGAGSPSRKAPRARRCPSCEQAFSGEARFCPFDGDALIEAPDYNPTADPLIGHVVDGRYEVIAVIGEGGMGTVYEVLHTALGRRFALKVLRRDIADAEHQARFIQEAKAAAGIGHPNIVAVSDFGELAIPGEASRRAPKVPYFVMEHLTGISLAGLLRSEKTLSPTRAAQIVLQCASGLAAAHTAGVIHRDLKPDNVFLTRNANKEFVKLLDFGVAKMAGAGRLTRAGMVFGTPHYMSPEQAAGQEVDQRADVYALGVILYECLAGRVPFEADTYMGVLTKHMFATPDPIELAVTDASKLGALGPVVMRCLAKSPQDRYANMIELAAAVEAAEDASTRHGDPRRTGTRARRGSSVGSLVTPGLRPALGPLGIGLGVLAAVLVVALVARELRSGAAGPAASASVSRTTSPAPTSSVATPVDTAAPATATPVDTAVPVDTAAPVETATAAPVDTAPTATSYVPPPQKPGRPSTPRLPSRPKSGDVVDPWGP